MYILLAIQWVLEITSLIIRFLTLQLNLARANLLKIKANFTLIRFFYLLHTICLYKIISTSLVCVAMQFSCREKSYSINKKTVSCTYRFIKSNIPQISPTNENMFHNGGLKTKYCN